MTEVQCLRCGKTAPLRVHAGAPFLPEGWEGTTRAGVCPGCQYAEWHPHCLAAIDWETGEVVDPEVDWAGMPPEERDYDRLHYCETIDLSVTTLDDDLPPDQSWRWTCPRCGTEHRLAQEGERETFDWVHRDYPPSGLRPGMFRVEHVDEDEKESER